MKTKEKWLAEMKAMPAVTENDLLNFIDKIQKDAARSAVAETLDEALNTGDGTYKP